MVISMDVHLIPDKGKSACHEEVVSTAKSTAARRGVLWRSVDENVLETPKCIMIKYDAH